MKQILSQDELISEISTIAKFTKSDIKVILDVFIEILEELVRESGSFDNEKTKLLMKVRNFGNLYLQRIPERRGRKGEMLPETTRPTFRLSQNIRFANKEIVEIGLEEDLDNFE